MVGELIVLVTCPRAGAEQIARPLVEEGLAACVNIVPAVTSVFRWQDKVEVEPEELMIIKTNRARWPFLEKRVKELHSYDTPEIISLLVEDGYKPYLDWLNSALRR